MADAKQAAGGSVLTRFGNINDLFIGVGVIAVVVMLIIPLVGWMLDILMALNLIFSLLVLLTVLYSQKPTEFSLFPTVLLVTTVFGLALNVSSTRRILTKGASFDGELIKFFSDFVVGGNSENNVGIVVGFIIFIIIIAVQVVVITKGATRVSEVAARFTLDGMPVRYMAIDTEYSSGSITEEEAQRRKAEIQKESQFYGAMDGASKFISGNVKIGILITAINVLGGIIVGTTIHGEGITDALRTYIRFSVGDGLLSQIPALLISTAMGVVVTRAAATGNLSEQVAEQFTISSRIYWISAAVLMCFALLPRAPISLRVVLILLAALMAFAGYSVGVKKKKAASFNEMMAKSKDPKKAKEDGSDMSPIVPLDALSLEIGYGLIPLVDKEKGAELLERVQNVRHQSALELGLVIPKVRIIDNMVLDPSEYCFKIKGIDVGRSKIRLGYFLCIIPGVVTEELPGDKTVDPAFGLPAQWISEDRRDDAERAGYTVVDPPSIIATHLTEIIRRHAAEILGLQDTQKILDTLRKEYPAVVDEVMRPELKVPVVKIQRILHGLLKERVSIRNMVTILEAIAEYAPLSGNVQFLTEKVRQALGSQICHQYTDDNHRLRVLTIAPELEQKIIESKYETTSGTVCAWEPAAQAAWIKAVKKSAQAVRSRGYQPVILCSEQARFLVKNSTERELPELAVISVQEITPDIIPEAIGIIRLEAPSSPPSKEGAPSQESGGE
jgi:flagellar biosynthesis protein FlhA